MGITQGEKKKKKKTEKAFEAIIENFSKLVSQTKPQVQEEDKYQKIYT